MKCHRYFLLVVLLCTPVFCVLLSCEKQGSNKSVSSAKLVEVTTYDHKGLKIVYPVDWSIQYDGPGIYDDRTVAFDTEAFSVVSVLFYKNSPRSISDHADALARQLKLEGSDNVENYQRSAIEIGGFKGFRLTWTSTFLSETRIELTVLQVRSEPFPVFVDFHLLDEDIELQKARIVPFVNGVSFDPQEIEL